MPPTVTRRRSTTLEADVAVADGRAAGRRDVRLAGARRARAHRPRRARPARRAARPHRRAARLVAGRARPRGAGRRPGRGLRLAARAARRPPRCARSRWPTGCARWTSSCRWPVATSAGARPTYASATWRRCCAATCRTATRSRRTPTRSAGRARRADPARLPHRVGRRRAAGARPGRATWSSTTRPTGSARSTSRSPRTPTAPRRWPRRWATPTTRCRRCCTPRCCTGSCAGGSPATTPSSHLGGVLYLYLRGMCGPDTPLVDGAPVRRLLLAAAGGPGRGAVRPARRRLPTGVRDDRAVRADRRARLAARRRSATGLLGELQRRRAARPPSDVHVAVRVGDARRRDRRAGAARGGARRARRTPRLGLRRPRHGRRRLAPELAWPDADAWVGRRRGLAAGRAGRGALGARPALPRPLPPARAQVCDDLAGRARPSRRPRSTRRALARRRRRGSRGEPLQRRAARRRGRGRAAAGPRCSPAVPAPARPPRSPGCWRCSPTRPPHQGGGCRSRSAAPTGKAAARLQEAVRAELARPRRPEDRDRVGRADGDDPAPAARLAARQRHPVPPRPRQPAQVRRGRRRRVLDGRADDDGPAARGGPAAGPAGAGRRPAPAHLGRRRRGAVATWSPATTASRLTGRLRSPRTSASTEDIKALGRGAPRGRRRRRARRRCAATSRRGRVRRDRRRAEAALRPDAVARRPRRPRGRPRPATPRRRSRRSTSTACCAPTARDRTAYATGTGRSSTGSAEETGQPTISAEWYVGRPLLVTANDYALDSLQRRDRGRGAASGRLRRRAFVAGSERLHDFAPGRLDAVETMHAMTIHKSQGSQAERVTVLLPDAGLAAADPRALLHRGHPGPGAACAWSAPRPRCAPRSATRGPARDRPAAAAAGPHG